MPILRDPHSPPSIFIESTYGDRLHDDEEDRRKEMAKKLVQHAIQHKSKIIVPAFSVGRIQDIIMRIKELVKNSEVDPIPIFIDSPLALKATKVFRQHPECYDEETYRTFTPTAAFRFNLASSQITFPTHRYSIEALLELLRQEAPRSKMRYEQE